MREIPEMQPLRPGYQTTEFWLTIAGNVGVAAIMAADILPPQYGVPALIVGNALYAVSRGMAKQAAPPAPRRGRRPKAPSDG